MTNTLFINNMESSTREGVIAKYAIYSNLINKAIDNGTLTYNTTWTGDIDSSSIKYEIESLNKTKEDTGIDYDWVNEYYK